MRGFGPVYFLEFIMSVEVFKDGKSFLIDWNFLEGHLQAGYTLDDQEKSGIESSPAKDKIELDPEEPKGDEYALLLKARALYKERFGEEPHHRLKLETIMEKLNGN